MAGPDSSKHGRSWRLVALSTSRQQFFALRARQIKIGSAADNDIRLDEPTVSRRHALLERRWRRWRIIDLGSTNGTSVNGRRIRTSSPVPLRRGDEVRFGNARFGFIRSGADVAKIAALSARRAASRGRRFSWPAAAAAAIAVFAIGFGLSEYLLNFSRLEQVAGVAGNEPATPAAGPRGASSGTSAADASASRPSAATAALGHGADSGIASGASTSPPHATTVAAVPPGAPGAPGGTAAGTAGADLQWLARINHYRAMVNLPPVSDDPALSRGERNHTRYLVENYAPLIRQGVDIGAAMHSENSTKPGYTPIGLRAGQQSDIDEWPGPQAPSSPEWAVDDWITGAFHRLNILNPNLRQVAYGEWCDGGTCAAALNVIGGAERPSFIGVALAKPVMFPPPDSKISLGPLWGEWPNPVSGCPGYKPPVGLPVTMQVGMMTDAKLGDYSFARVGEAPVELPACGVDAFTYTNPDAVAQQRGRDVMHDLGAVMLIPRVPLQKDATYTVVMTVNGRKYRWSFSTAP